MPDLSQTLPYGDIYEMHKRLSEESPFFQGQTLPQFAGWANDITQSQRFAAAANDNWIKRASHAVDTFMGPSAEASAEAARLVAQNIAPQYEPQITEFGKALPRDIATMSLFGLGPVGIAGAAGLAGAKTYEQTDSPVAGAAVGGLTALIPAFARAGGAAASKAVRGLMYGSEQVGAETVAGLAPTFPLAGMLERGAEAAGRQVGALINNEMAVQSASVATTGEFVPITPQHIAELAGPQVAFALLDLPGVLFGKGYGVHGDLRSGTAAQAERARIAAIDRWNTKQKEALERQGQKLQVQVPVDSPVKGTSTETIELTSKIDDTLQQAKETADKIANTERRSNAVAEIAKLSTGALIPKYMQNLYGPELLAELTKSGILSETPGGSAWKVEKLLATDDDLVVEALASPTAQIASASMMVRRQKDLPPRLQEYKGGEPEAMQSPASEEMMRRQFTEPPLPEKGKLVRSDVELSVPVYHGTAYELNFNETPDAGFTSFATHPKEASGYAEGFRGGERVYVGHLTMPTSWVWDFKNPEHRNWALQKLREIPNLDDAVRERLEVGHGDTTEVGAPSGPPIARIAEQAPKLLQEGYWPLIEVLAPLMKETGFQAFLTPGPARMSNVHVFNPKAFVRLGGEPGVKPPTAPATERIVGTPPARDKAGVLTMGPYPRTRELRTEEVEVERGTFTAQHPVKDAEGNVVMLGGQPLTQPVEMPRIVKMLTEVWRVITQRPTGLVSPPAPSKPLLTHATGEPSTATAKMAKTAEQARAERGRVAPEDWQEPPSDAIVRQLQPYVEQAMMADLGIDRSTALPADIKMARLKLIANQLEVAIRRALTVTKPEVVAVSDEPGVQMRHAEGGAARGKKTKVVWTETGRHELFEKYVEEFKKNIDTIGERLGKAPTLELMEQAYSATMAHVATLTKGLARFNTELDAKLSPKLDPAVATNLNKLSFKPWGDNVLQALANVLSSHFRMSQRPKEEGGGYEAGPTAREMGLISDKMYYGVIAYATKLLDEATWSKAVSEWKAAHAELAHRPQAEQELRAAERFIRKVQKDVKDDAETQAIFNQRYLAQELADSNVPTDKLELTALWAPADPVQQAKIDAMRSWLIGKFDRPLTFEEWNAAGKLKIVTEVLPDGSQRMKETLEPIQPYGRGNQGTPEAMQRKANSWNVLIDALKNGELQARHERAGFTLEEPDVAMKAEILQRVGKEPGDTPERTNNNWKNFRNRDVAELLERVEAMAVRDKEVIDAEVQSSSQGAPGSPEAIATEGSQLAADALQRGPSPSPMALTAATKEWFRGHFARRGMTPDAVEMYSDILARIAAAFPEATHTKIGTLFDANRFGWSVNVKKAEGVWRHLVGVEPNNVASWIRDPRVAAIQVAQTLSHELIHVTLDQGARGVLPDFTHNSAAHIMMAAAENLDPTARTETLWRLVSTLVPKDVQTQEALWGEFNKFRAETAAEMPAEWLADYGSYVVLGAANPDRTTTIRAVNDHILFSDSHTQQFLQGHILSVLDMSEGMQQYLALNRPEVAMQLARVNAGFRLLLPTFDQIQKAVDGLRQIELAEPARYAQWVSEGLLPKPFNPEWTYKTLGLELKENSQFSVTKALHTAGEWMGLKESKEATERYGVKVPWLRNNFMEWYQLEKLYPILAGVGQAVRAFRPIVNDLSNKMLMPLMVTTKWLKQQRLDVEGHGIRYVLTHDKAREEFNKIALLTMKENGGKAYSEGELRLMMIRSPKETQDRVIDFYQAVKTITPQIREVLIRGLRDSAFGPVGQLLMKHDTALRADTAKDYAKHIVESVWNNTPVALPATTPKLLDAVALARDVLAVVREFETNSAAIEWRLAETRVGKYIAAYVNPKAATAIDKTGYAAFDTKDAAIAWAKKESARTGVPLDKFHFQDKSLKDPSTDLPPDYLMALQKMERAAQMHQVMQLNLSKDLTEKVLAYMPLDRALEDTTTGGTEKYLLEKKIRAGRETLDLASNFIPSVRGMATALAKRYVRADAGIALMDPELRTQEYLHKRAVEQYQTQLNPPTGEYSFLKRMLFSYFLGFSPSSFIMNASDSVLQLAPQLTQDTGGVALGYRYVGAGMKELTHLAINKKCSDPTLDAMMMKARKNGRLDFGITQELYDEETRASVNMRAMLAGSEGVDGYVKLGTRALDLYGTLGRNLYSYAPKLNSHVAFFAGYKAATEHGVWRNGKLSKLTPDEAYNYAVSLVDMTQHGGGTMARPGMFSNLGKFHGAVGLAYSLSTYTVGTLSMMARMGIESLQHVPGPQRTAARKALGQVMFTQAAMAGVLGMPGVAVTFAVLNKFFPGIEASKAVADGFAALAGDDDEMGGVFSDVAMRGVLNKVSGVDFASRLGLSSMMGVNPYDGISLASMMGPTGSIVGNLIRATQYASTGEPMEAVQQLVPQPFKNVVDLYKGGGVIRDKGGAPIVEPSGAEAAAYVLGLKPARLTAFKDRQRMIEQHEDVVQIENRRFNEQVAQLVMMGDFAGARQAMFNRQVETHNNYLAVRGAEDVAALVVNRQAPVDLARSGSSLGAAERRRLAAPLGTPTWSETQRLQTKKSLAAQLGVPGAGRVAPTELRRAQIVDSLMASNPVLGLQQARQMADVMLGARVPMPY